MTLRWTMSSRYSKYHVVSSNYKPFYSELQYYYFISEHVKQNTLNILNSVRLKILLRSLKSKFTVSVCFSTFLTCHIHSPLVYKLAKCQNQGERPQRC